MSSHSDYLAHKCAKIQERLDELGLPLVAEVHRGRFGGPPSDIQVLDQDGNVIGQLPDDADPLFALIPRGCAPESVKLMIEAFAVGFDEGYEVARNLHEPLNDISWG